MLQEDCQSPFIFTFYEILNLNKEFNLFQAGGLSSLTGSASSHYVPSSDYSPLPPIRPQIGMPPTTMYRHNVHTSQSISGGLGSMMDQPPYYSLASPPFEGQISGSHVQQNDPLGMKNKICKS